MKPISIKTWLVCVSILFINKIYAQNSNVGIGTLNPEQSAVLDVSSTNKGFLIPRMTNIEKSTIANPAKGLLIYQTNSDEGFYFYNGKQWSPLSQNEAKSLAAANPDNWSITGNSGTSASTNFIGTVDNIPLQFKVNNAKSGLISPSGNTFYGYGSGQTNPIATGLNSAFGSLALYSNTTGTSNSAFGYLSLSANTIGSFNSAFGTGTLGANTTGSYNNAIGYYVLSNNTTGTGNNAIGFGTLQTNSTGDYNNAMGLNSLNKNTSGTYNNGFGANALFNNTTGSNNNAFGLNAARALTSGSNNNSFGLNSLFKNTTGVGNTVIGNSTLYENTSGNNNVAIGNEALKNNVVGSSNVAIGYQAGTEEVGSNKLYIANNSTTMPLIYGDFSAKYVTIGDVSPSLRSQGIATGGYNLLVKGGILTEKVKVALAAPGTDWADYVFEPTYIQNMLTLDEVEKYTIKNKHLPNVPSADQMVKDGLDISKTSKMFMEKIEELTLYLIQLNKEVKALKVENEQLKAFNK